MVMDSAVVSAYAVVPATDTNNLTSKLEKLEEVLNLGLISVEEHRQMRDKVLEEFSNNPQPTSGVVPFTPSASILDVTSSSTFNNSASSAVVSIGNQQSKYDMLPQQEQYNQFSYGYHSAIIMFPIAGHPDFDKGAYHHPIGLCCYTDNRTIASEDMTGQILFCPITTALWLGTLCYQPCGCICAHQFPWLGDCLFSRQRVTEKFRREFPDKVTSSYGLVLVPKGSKSQCIFEDVANLRQGKLVKLRLWSHPNGAICKKYEAERHFQKYRYIESHYGESRIAAISVRYEEENFLSLEHADLVFDVSFWKLEEGTAVNFVGGGPTKKRGGGRDWTINDDGTIACKHKPNLVLGF